MSSLPPWPEGYDRAVRDVVTSTMDVAAATAPQMSGPGWILGLRQTAGRGRRGKGWADPPGNFAASLVLLPDCAPDRAALRSFVAALALREALEHAGVASHMLSLKWPNDVLLNGGKVAGILLESQARGAEVDRLIIGIGVNLAHVPPADPAAAFPPVSVAAETGLSLQPEAFLTRLAHAFDGWERAFKTHGFGPVRAAWLAHAARRDQEITARTGDRTETGIFTGLDETGNLILDTSQGRRHIAAADIFF